MENKKVSIIGCGRLGATFALLCEQAGFNVVGCDKREDYVNSLNNKTHKTSEPQVEQMLAKAKRFIATTDINTTISHSDLLFVFVPTPSKENGEYDHQYIEQVVENLREYSINGGSLEGKTLVIGCTVMPWYCKSLHDRLSIYEMSVVYNPSFISQGDIVKNLQNPDFVLAGGPERYGWDDLGALHRSIVVTETYDFIYMSHTAAEITKMAVNCYLTMKISFANMIGEIAIKSGESASVNHILNTIGRDSRIGSKYMKYGFGYGGVCLPRDQRALGVHADKIGLDSGIQDAVDWANGFHFHFLKEQFMQANPDRNFPFIFNQLGYKKGVDILTESQHYRLCLELLGAGYKVIIVESDSVVAQVKPELERFGDRVTYGLNGASKFKERIGYEINL